LQRKYCAFCRPKHLIPQRGRCNIQNLWIDLRKSDRGLYNRKIEPRPGASMMAFNAGVSCRIHFGFQVPGGGGSGTFEYLRSDESTSR
jgi:hypothetical protein